MLEIVKGNILDCKEDIILHQVNTLGKMGAGVARSIRFKYPEVFEPYMNEVSKAIEAGATPDFLLGKVVYAPTYDGKEVAHFFGQSMIRTKERPVDVPHDYYSRILYSALLEVKEKAKREGKSIAMPFGMGCVLGGANWENSYWVIQNVFALSEVQLKIYKL